jgi:hypothetical protein
VSGPGRPGRLRWVDLGAGGWEVELPGGDRRPVAGAVPRGAREGDAVDVIEEPEAVGYLMTGAPSVRVLGLRRS